MVTTYEVRYREYNRLFFRTIKNVRGDFVAKDLPQEPRVFILADESRVEVPTQGTVFEFSKERFMTIKQLMELEAKYNKGN